nr:hypothetical protein Itr_chr11CG08690 [Ipomoea trifida]
MKSQRQDRNLARTEIHGHGRQRHATIPPLQPLKVQKLVISTRPRVTAHALILQITIPLNEPRVHQAPRRRAIVPRNANQYSLRRQIHHRKIPDSDISIVAAVQPYPTPFGESKRKRDLFMIACRFAEAIAFHQTIRHSGQGHITEHSSED